MIITSVKVDNFKNLVGIRLNPDSKYNVIIGKNAQGKTNLLEAMWILTGCKSFRGSKEKDYVCLDERKMSSEIEILDSIRSQKILYELVKSPINAKSLYLNDVKMKGTSSLFDVFKCIIFTPDDVDIIKGSPEKRRGFIDMAASQLNPIAVTHLTKHSVVMNQRNALLKSIMLGNSSIDQLVPWDKQAAKEGTYISYMRFEYIKKLNEICNRLYSKITGNTESLTITYRSNVFKESDFDTPLNNISINTYYNKLKEMTEYDIKTGYTHVGANRDEIIIKINGNNAKEFGSQGQIKSSALVIKLAQAEIYKKLSKESPVVFLDDVMGELDESRQKLVFDIIKNMQVFITTCNESALLPEINGKIIRIENGKIV